LKKGIAMRITLERGLAGSYLVLADNGASVLVQVDWDFPGLASSFGWLPCFCGRTDDTIDCPHRTAEVMIGEAREHLDRHLGETVDDPGYFTGQ
jgi:hypothetical protein